MHGNEGIMLDLETLGTEPGAGITEVGFCTFNYRILQTREQIQLTGQHHTITLIDNLRHRMTVKPSTLDWWDYEQHGLPQFSKRSMQATLATVADELNNLWKRGIKDVWAKPALFDVPILQEAMDALNIERPLCLLPENFRHWQCFASLRRIVTDFSFEMKEHPEFKKHATHNALLDAVDQAVQTNIMLTILPAWRSSHFELLKIRNQANEVNKRLLEDERQRKIKLAKALAKRRRNARAKRR